MNLGVVFKKKAQHTVCVCVISLSGQRKHTKAKTPERRFNQTHAMCSALALNIQLLLEKAAEHFPVTVKHKHAVSSLYSQSP